MKNKDRNITAIWATRVIGESTCLDFTSFNTIGENQNQHSSLLRCVTVLLSAGSTVFSVNIMSAVLEAENKASTQDSCKVPHQLAIATPRYGLAQGSVPHRKHMMFPGQAV